MYAFVRAEDALDIEHTPGPVGVYRSRRIGPRAARRYGRLTVRHTPFLPLPASEQRR